MVEVFDIADVDDVLLPSEANSMRCLTRQFHHKKPANIQQRTRLTISKVFY